MPSVRANSTASAVARSSLEHFAQISEALQSFTRVDAADSSSEGSVTTTVQGCGAPGH
ncbi:hypothetical protein [Cupriavidus sp. CuC1]|uniref:hypothetical protein n=1 Tax=Cupriavidus sp. CuC1 TaxID=3373131 RepID=UPI0037D7907E